MTDQMTAFVPHPMDAPPIRWGILGPGGIARRFAKEIPAYTSSQVVAVGSRSLERAQRFVAENLADTKVAVYGSYEDLVADDSIDAIYVSSPHGYHRDHAILALEAGKPVLVEKAFTLNAAQAQEVFDVAEAKGLFAMEAMWSRFLPHYIQMRALVDSGALGEVRAIIGVHAQALNLDPAWRMMNADMGGGALLDLGIYPMSAIHWLWGVPDSITAVGERTASGVDLRETIVCRYGTRLASAYTDMEVAADNVIQVIGTEAMVEIPTPFYAPQDLILTPVQGRSEVIPTRCDGGFQYEAAEVARCLAAGRTQSESMSWQDTVEVLRMTDEVRRQLGVVYPVEMGAVPR